MGGEKDMCAYEVYNRRLEQMSSISEVKKNVPLTATAIRESEKEYWKVAGPAINRRAVDIIDNLIAPAYDKILRFYLRNAGVSYRKFMSDRVKLNIE